LRYIPSLIEPFANIVRGAMVLRVSVDFSQFRVNIIFHASLKTHISEEKRLRTNSLHFNRELTFIAGLKLKYFNHNNLECNKNSPTVDTRD